ncbi:MAG: hypothetical protein P2A85_26540 [Microcoleus anatoxicus]|uniref:hypothetical protein n=1 Tax=Microcoleus anatoxicus TaxID=2705319 RepID=UPI003670C315
MRNYELSKNKERSPSISQIQKGDRPSFINHGDRPSYIRVNLRPSAVKKERSPFLIIQKGDRPFYNQSWRSLKIFPIHNQ